MPTLDANGHVPKALMLEVGWEKAAMRCGVDAADVQARYALIHRLHDRAIQLANTAGDYVDELGLELERWPTAPTPDEIAAAANATRERWAAFMAAADQARSLVEGSDR